MRLVENLTTEEMAKIRKLLNVDHPELENPRDVKYQLFTKSRPIYSGLYIVKVYEYLKSIGVDVFAY